MRLLKKTMISFFLSTFIHIGLVSGYYYTYLWLNPDDPDKKKFYSIKNKDILSILNYSLEDAVFLLNGGK